MRGDTTAPDNGIPSLTPAEITAIYQEVFNRPPDANELATDSANALKYSAAGIERGIRLRGSNDAGSGVRGDENLPSLTFQVPHPAIAGNVVTMGPAALAPTSTPTGPTGTLAAPNTYGAPIGLQGGPIYVPATPAASFGLDATTLLIIAAMAAGAFFFLRK
jgi:hypothetical protein